MDDTQIIASQNYQEKNKSKFKIVLIVLAVILAMGAVGGVAFFLGTKSQSEEDTETQVAQSPTPTDLPENTSAPSLSATKKPSITSKPTSTSTPTPTVPILKTKILSSIAALDGFRSSNGGGNATLEIRSGRNSNLVTRGFITFDISDIPSGAGIQSATLRLYQADIEGNPYDVGGSIKVDHLTYGDSLDNTDYASPALSSSFVTLTSNAIKEWKDADVTEKLKDDVANARSTSQFRIHFQTETTGGDVTGDFAYFEAKENNQGTGNTPQLVVKYY